MRPRPRAPRAGRALTALLLSAAIAIATISSSLAASLPLASAPALTLDAARHGVTLTLDAVHGAALRQVARGQPAALPGDPARYRSAVLVLDDVTLTAAGARGGYFYRIYIVPAGDGQVSERQQVGTLGPFEVSAARQRGVGALRYTLGGALAGSGGERLGAVEVVFRRAGGEDVALMGIGGVRVELSTEVEN